jgi:hypothetical protein
VNVVNQFPAVLEIALMKATRCDDHERATELEGLERMRGRPRHVEEVARDELDLLVAELEGVPAREDVEPLPVLLVAVQRHAATGEMAPLEERVMPLGLCGEGLAQRAD